MKAHYRIVQDAYHGFEVQEWRWWWPFWSQIRVNSHRTIEEAEAYAIRNAHAVVKYLGPLP